MPWELGVIGRRVEWGRSPLGGGGGGGEGRGWLEGRGGGV